MCFKSKNKANLYQIKNFTLFKKLFSLLKSFKKLQRTGPQRVPPCRSLHVQLKLELALAIRNNLPGSSRHFFPSSLVFLIVVEWFLIVIACFSKAKNKANLYQIKNFTLFKKVVFFIKILLKNCKKTGPQRAPPCRSLHLQLKTGISTCNKKQPSWL